MRMDVRYLAVDLEAADQAWEAFPEHLTRMRRSGFDGVRHASDEEMRDVIDALESSPEELPWALRRLDLSYGSVASCIVEEGKLEWFVYCALRYTAQVEEGEVTRSSLLQIFSRLSEAYVQAASVRLAEEMQWSVAEAREGILLYLRSVRPVAKALKERPDLRFIHEVDGAYDSEVEALFRGRAEAHLKRFQEWLQP